MANKDEDLTVNQVYEKLDKYLAEFATSNINRKANELGAPLVQFISKYRLTLENYGEIHAFVEGLAAYWVHNQNTRVS